MAVPVSADRGRPAWMILTVIAAAALAALILLPLVLRKKKAASSKDVRGPLVSVPENISETTQRVYMRLVVQEGALASGPEELELTGPLFIGSDPGYTIILRAEGGEIHHVKLFLMNGAVYLEYLQTPGGTTVNGKRLDLPQVLRSGDSITIGGLTFQVKF